MGLNKYQKIWVNANGEIPRTEDGRMFHIHHIDGNRNNNELSNLMCVSPMEHFLIHLSQQEYMSAHALYIRYLTDEEKIGYSYVPKLAAMSRDNSNIGFNNPDVYKKVFDLQNERIKNGCFHLQSGEIQRKTNLKRVSLGIHNFQSETHKAIIRESNKERVANGSHPFVNGKRSDWVLKSKKCEFCGYVGRGVGFLYKHDDYCIQNSNNKLVTCSICGVKRHPSIIFRYHNEKCKHNEPSTTSRKT